MSPLTYGGAGPGVIGAGIYLLWPVFYNDLNDSYRLSRAGRLRADLGGVYFNVVFILVLVAIYSLTGYEALLVGVAAQHLAILQQFLPFVRLDGYYVVSDVAGVPNLFGRIRPIMLSWLPRGRRNPVEQSLRRGARIIVTTWVLLTAPLLGACLVLRVVRLPSVVGVGLESARTHLGAFSAAVRDGAVLTGLGSALHLVFLAVMFIGLSFTIARVVRRVLWRPRQGTPPGVVEQPTGPEQAAPTHTAEDDWLAGPFSCVVADLDPADVWDATALRGRPAQPPAEPRSALRGRTVTTTRARRVPLGDFPAVRAGASGLLTRT